MYSSIHPTSIVTITEEVGAQRLTACIKYLGADKFILSSDHIVGMTSDKLSAKKQIRIIGGLLGLSSEEKELILSENAKEILKL